MGVIIHPAVVHFAIALSLTAALLYGLSLLLRSETLKSAAILNFNLAAVAAVTAVVTGILSEEAAESAGISHQAHELLETHGALGYVAGGVVVVVAVLRRLAPSLRERYALIYLALIILSAALIGLNGYLGGKMVFEHGLGVKTVPATGIQQEPSGDPDKLPNH